MKQRAALLFIALVLVLGAGCAQDKTGVSSSRASQRYYSFEDSLGREVSLARQPQRVVALFGSYAQTWLLSGGSLVGVTEDVVSERNLPIPQGSQVIGTVKDPNLELVIALDPDFVLLSSDIQSHVKASSLLDKLGIPHAFFKVEHFEDYLHMLDICTDITGRKDLYESNGLAVQRQIEQVLEGVGAQTPAPTVLFARAFSSKVKAKADDNMTCRMLSDLGAVNIAASHSVLEDLTLESILAADPDYILVVPMGDTQRALQAVHDQFQVNPAWSGLSAVREGRYHVLPKELFHYKPNDRWGESYEYLARLLYE